MFDINKLDKRLKEQLSKERYEHSVSVMRTAEELAGRFGADRHTAAFLGLYHDMAKEYSLEKCRDICIKNNYVDNYAEDGFAFEEVNLLHGPAAAFIFKEEYYGSFGSGWLKNGEDCFNAIFYHTTGSKDMPLLGKIIFTADKIEPLNDFPGIDDIRKMANQNLDKTMLMLFDRGIMRIIEKRQYLHPYTVEARNYYLSREEI